METDATITRRAALSKALAAGALGAGGAAAGALLSAPSPAAAAQPTDAQLVYGTLAVELLVIAVYEHVIASGLLSIANGMLARRQLAHERAHAKALRKELEALGTAPPPSLAGAGASSLDAILATRHAPASLANMRTEADALRLLVAVEEVAEGAYYDAISKLTDSQLLLRSAQIMAAEAQHRTVLSEALAPGDLDKAVPVAFVQGRR